MINHIPEILLSQLSELIADRMGLHFPRERWHDLERGISSAAEEFGFQDAGSCIQWLLSSPLIRKQMETLAGHLTVGETYFFREKRSFEILEEHVLPEWIRSRRETGRYLKIWSAGCSTGEEPYSIVILLRKMILDWKDWNITILATDINPRFLQKASEGLYHEWSFRDTPPWVKERYFKRKKEGCFEILPSIREMVTFSYLNLAEDAYPSPLNHTHAIDVIFCRNVLMYFAAERAKKIIQNLHLSLVEGGWLIVGPSETSQSLFSQFASVNFSDAIFYKKGTRGTQTVEVFPHGQLLLPSGGIRSDDFGPPPAATEIAAAGPEERKAQEPRRTLYGEALTLYEQERYAEVAEKLAGLPSYNQETPGAMALLARAYADQGKLAEAQEWVEKAIAVDRLNLGLHYLHATILQEQGAIDEAIKSLNRALYLDPNFVLAHFALGNLALRQGKFKESDKRFEHLLSLLSPYRSEEPLPESGGMTAGRLREIVQSTICKEKSA